MADEEVYQRILEHLEKDGPFNTFRLATDLNLDHQELLSFIKELEIQGAVKVQHGVVKFLKFVVKEKKAEKLAEVKKITPKPKKKAVKKRKNAKKRSTAPKVQAENKELKEKILQLESKVEELKKKASVPPRIITRTITKKVPVIKTFIKRDSAHTRPKKKIWEKLKIRSKHLKFPKFKFMKSIRKLKH